MSQEPRCPIHALGPRPLGEAHVELLDRLCKAGPDGLFMQDHLRELTDLKAAGLADYIGGGSWAAVNVRQERAALLWDLVREVERKRLASAIRAKYESPAPDSAAAELGARLVVAEIAADLEAGRL